MQDFIRIEPQWNVNLKALCALRKKSDQNRTIVECKYNKDKTGYKDDKLEQNHSGM